jgi:transcriptional regulator with PAS, ATPase and Fis domain
MTRVKEMIPRIAATASPVLIEGESGTGKELAAVAIHRLSARHRGPFVPVNCGAIPLDLLESEFFGHVRGAFTGAVADSLGLFRAAHGGTLFLDEVTELPPRLQVKLLRILEEKHVRPVGSTRMHAADVRIIAASNRPLEDALQDRSFRPDLFYRLNVLRLVMPPLRERKADIPILALYLLRQLNQRFGCKVQDVSPDAMAALMAYDFPGNVRELENLLERAYALGAGRQIALADLPGLRPAPPALAPAETLPTLAEVEQELIQRALRLYRNDRALAARALGISRRTIARRMKENGRCVRSLAVPPG